MSIKDSHRHSAISDYLILWAFTDLLYNLDGGVNNPNNPSFYTIESDVTISYPTKEDYAFVGWTTTNITEPTKTYRIEKGSYGDITLNANYIHGMVSVSFYGYEEYDQVIDYNTLCTKPTDPTKLGDTFDYWATDDSLSTPFDLNLQ